MSVRRKDVERAADVARSFTLRGVVTQDTVDNAQQKARSAAAAAATPSTANLKFNLAQKTAFPSSAPPAAASPQPAASNAAVRAATAPPPTSSVFKTATASKGTDSAEVMRLTAYVDDLSKRLRETGSKLQTAELQLSRTNQALVAERHTASKKFAAMKSDISAAHETEAKLRSEMQVLNAAQAAQDAPKPKFADSVQSALATEAINSSKIQEAEELKLRVDALADTKMQLEAGIAALKLEQGEAEIELKKVFALIEEKKKEASAIAEAVLAKEQRLAAMMEAHPEKEDVKDAAPAVQPAVADLLGLDPEPVAAPEPEPEPEAPPAYEPYEPPAQAAAPTDCCDYDTKSDEAILVSPPSSVASVSSAPPPPQPYKAVVTGTAPKPLYKNGRLQKHALHSIKTAGIVNAPHFSNDCPISLGATDIDANENGMVLPNAGGDVAMAPEATMEGLIKAVIFDTKVMLVAAKTHALVRATAVDGAPKSLFVPTQA